MLYTKEKRHNLKSKKLYKKSHKLRNNKSSKLKKNKNKSHKIKRKSGGG